MFHDLFGCLYIVAQVRRGPRQPPPTLTMSPSVTGLPAATTLLTHTAQHPVRLASDTGVDTTTVRRARLTSVRGTTLAPLARTDVRGVDTLRVHAARALAANREALTRAEETLLTALAEHNGTGMALGSNLAPPSPRHSTASRPATTITLATVTSHSYTSY